MTLAPELAELERALHRTGRDPAPDVDARAPRGPARRLGRRRAAYVRARARPALRARDGAADARAAPRAAPRSSAAGLGLRGALRAWWALPPLPLGAALKDRLRRPYTPK